MMSNHQVVVIREAQDLKGLIPKKGTGESSGKDKESLSDLLIAYVNKPQASTILVFCCKYKNLDKRSKLYKALEKNGVVFQSEFLYENKIPDWIEKYLKTKNSKINSRAALLLTEYLGTNLGKISNELDKLLLNIQAGEEITSEHIEKYIGISKDYNVFELQEALGKKNLQKSFRIVKYMGLNPKAHPFPMTIGNLYGFFAKILRYHTLNDRSRASVAESLGVPPFFVTDYENAARNYPLPAVIDVVSILHEFDLKTKGIESASTDDGELLQEMVSRIIMN